MDSRTIFSNFDNMLQDSDSLEYLMGLEALVEGICRKKYYEIEHPFYMQLISHVSNSMKNMKRQTGGQMAGHGYEVAMAVKEHTKDFVARTSALLHDFVEETGDQKIVEKSKFDNLPRNGTTKALQEREYDNAMHDMAYVLGNLLHKSVCLAAGNNKYYEDASFEIQDVVKTLTRYKSTYYEDIGAIVGADVSHKSRIVAMLVKIEDARNNISTMNPTKIYKDSNSKLADGARITPNRILQKYYLSGNYLSLYLSMYKNKFFHLFSRKGPYRTTDKIYKAYKSLAIMSSFRGFRNEAQYMYENLESVETKVIDYVHRNDGCGLTTSSIQSLKDIERVLTVIKTNKSVMADVSSFKRLLVNKHIYFNDRKSIDGVLNNLSNHLDTKDIKLYMQLEHYAHHLRKFGFNRQRDKLTGLGMLMGLWQEYNLDNALNKLTNAGFASMNMAINHMATYHSHPRTVKNTRIAVQDHANIEKFTEVGDKYDGFIRRNFDPRIRKSRKYKYWIKIKTMLNRNTDLDAAMLFRRIYEHFIKDPEYVMHGLSYNGIVKEGWY